jgi:hypothetical protein
MARMTKVPLPVMRAMSRKKLRAQRYRPKSEIFLYQIAFERVAIVTPVPTVGGR